MLESAEVVVEVAIAWASHVLESTEVSVQDSPCCCVGATVISHLGNWTHSVGASEATSFVLS